MDRSYPSALRIQQRLRFRHRVAAGAITAIAVSALAFAMGPQPVPSPDAAAPAALPSAISSTVQAAQPAGVAAPSARRVYRYSVVPGGAANGAELAQVVAADKVVAAHYADFDVAAARPVTVSAPRAVYVSYRKGDQIYWTAKKVMLQAGETLLTDGRNEMRARCANRISELPRFPVEKRPPPLETLDTFAGGPADDEEGSSMVFVSGPELEGFDDLPQLTGEPFQPVWPAAGTPKPTPPAPGRTPPPLERGPGFPWPPMAWNGFPGVPPSFGTKPGVPPILTFAPPPLARAMGEPNPPPLLATEEPNDPSPFVPQPDPGQPAQPPNPALDLPPPNDVPEPATPWLAALALAAMLGVRKKR